MRRFLPIFFDLERANQLSLLPDKDLVDLCPLIESYQVTKSPMAVFVIISGRSDTDNIPTFRRSVVL
ncbi:hypothetical protein [Microcystis sp. M090S1]|uniref:hypothetical protein n=1 Tax=Microcystis sp. M090S1 TaxID=2771135 RepID=UPI002584B7A4|nr:hypothetical protein [Microcystis sp. M090S1]